MAVMHLRAGVPALCGKPLAVPCALGRRSRRVCIIRAVARPSAASGASSGSGDAAPASGGLSSKLKALVTPFSDPQANSKMLSLATGRSHLPLFGCLSF